MLMDQVWLLKDADRLVVSRFVVDQYCSGKSRFNPSDLENQASLIGGVISINCFCIQVLQNRFNQVHGFI